jgi:UDPglucose--hexose-1-phosphate uridylyltransferase
MEGFDLEAVMAQLSAAGVEAGIDEDTPSGHDRIETELMGLLLGRPSTINKRFHELRQTEGPQAATDWFYRYAATRAMCARRRLQRT